VDLNTLKPVWAIDTLDNIDATPALDVESDTSIALYTGNTILNRTKKGTVCTIRRVNALTGETEWTYDVPNVAYQKKQDVGCYASPVVGQNSISDLVFFTVANGKNGSSIIALEKATGKLVWENAMESNSVSSPVAVYNENGDAWILQAEQSGLIHLMNARTGEVLDSLQLTADDAEAVLEIKASPAVYGNLMLIGTTGTKAGGVYCIKID
jgi:outer membrane protein assembly factor BamB